MEFDEVWCTQREDSVGRMKVFRDMWVNKLAGLSVSKHDVMCKYVYREAGLNHTTR